jgi:hypothetical protein
MPMSFTVDMNSLIYLSIELVLFSHASTQHCTIFGLRGHVHASWQSQTAKMKEKRKTFPFKCYGRVTISLIDETDKIRIYLRLINVSNMMRRFSSRKRLWLFTTICLWILLQTVYISSRNYNILCAKWRFIPIKLISQVNRTVRTTCSLSADRRGDKQNVISYSIYGNFSQSRVYNRYLKPFKETVVNIPHAYPGNYRPK